MFARHRSAIRNTTLASASLVQQLFGGPIDIVGDVHGEIDALRTLMAHLGYRDNGTHPQDRRLVFLGDLIDRGEDSPAVIELVSGLMNAGRAQCVLGNHDLNILLGHRKHDNGWFFGDEFSDDRDKLVPQKLADESIKTQTLDFFRTLPLALEREDLRIVHACWHDEMIKIAADSTDVQKLFDHHAAKIKKFVTSQNTLNEIDVRIEKQNRNPVKVLTSGLEQKVDKPFEASGKLRYEKRVEWWKEYNGQRFCVFGHYSIPLGKPRRADHAFCVDFGVGKRWKEREKLAEASTPPTKLAAIRIPEREVWFDDGSSRSWTAA